MIIKDGKRIDGLGDSMPIGSIVEIAGIEVPDGWEILPGDANVYVGPVESTEGQEVWIQKGKNLIDPNNVCFGYINDSSGNLNYNTTALCTGFVEIEPDKDYYFLNNKDGGNWGAWYDENKQRVGGINFGGTKAGVVHSPYNAKYFRFTLSYNNNNDNFASNTLVAQSSVAIDFEPYVEEKVLVKNDNGVYETFYKNKGIIDSGSNANGDWIKFADGTMICTVDMTVTNQAINSRYGDTALYYGVRDWTYPHSFKEVKTIICGCFKWGTGGSWGSVNGYNATEASLFGYDFYPRETGTNCRINALAIGRWK